ncbi:hypothetical protein FQR65_LT08647 [Abscondita terminalis]|nr:hypothetical protein FQR65_LT08647 [Abscondita terminalis]
MDRWIGKVAIVTGSSLGIGSSIVKVLVNAGLKVVGFDILKNETKFEGRGSFYPLVVDITKEENVLYGYDWIEKNLEPAHILINVAGVRKSTTVIDGNSEMWKDTLDVNVFGLCLMTREAVRRMRKHEVDGHIVNINSMCGHMIPPLTDLNVYPASKYAVTALTETVRQELREINSKIKITSVSPGLVKTRLMTPEYSKDQELLKSMPSLDPEDIANAILFVLSTRPHVQVHELTIT